MRTWLEYKLKAKNILEISVITSMPNIPYKDHILHVSVKCDNWKLGINVNGRVLDFVPGTTFNTKEECGAHCIAESASDGTINGARYDVKWDECLCVADGASGWDTSSDYETCYFEGISFVTICITATYTLEYLDHLLNTLGHHNHCFLHLSIFTCLTF